MFTACYTSKNRSNICIECIAVFHIVKKRLLPCTLYIGDVFVGEKLHVFCEVGKKGLNIAAL